MGWRQRYWQAREEATGALKRVRSRIRPLLIPLAQRGNAGVYAIELEARVGFFAQMNWLLYILRHCEQRGLRPRICFSSPWYRDPAQGANWLAYHFEARTPGLWLEPDAGPRPLRISRAEELDELGLPRRVFAGLTLEEASLILGRHLEPVPAVTGLVDGFVARHFEPGATLGVHYRATDKGSEARVPTADEMLAAIRAHLEAHPHYRRIYLASDDGHFVDRAQAELGGVPVIVREGEIRSRDGRAVHTRADGETNLQKGREALVNCLLLARCDGLLRTASFLSGWASVFNPGLPVRLLNPPHAHANWFPDRSIVERGDGAAAGR